MVQAPSSYLIDQWLLTTDPGLEPLVEKEWKARYPHWPTAFTHRPFSMKGKTLLQCGHPQAEVEAALWKLRTIHRIYRLRHTFSLPVRPTMENLAEVVGDMPIPDLADTESFRVSTERMGEHGFDTFDILRIAGAAFQAQYQTPVNLKGYTCEIMVDIKDQRGWVGISVNRKTLANHWDRIFIPRTPLRANIAYGLLLLADITPEQEGILLDPCCGSGTILFEASVQAPKLTLWGSDFFDEAVEGAQANTEHAGLQDRISIRQADARHLAHYYEPQSIDYLITNPPFGLRWGKGLNLFWFYENLLVGAAVLLKPQGRMVVLVMRRDTFRQALKEVPELVEEDCHYISMGGKHFWGFRLGLANKG